MPFIKNYTSWLKTLLLFLLLQKSSSVDAQLKADFSANITEGCTPLVVQFSDASAGSPTEWTWDLGNGSIAKQRNPSAIYITPGTYTVKLTVKNNSGEDSVEKLNYIVVHASPVVNFAGSPLAGCVPVTVQFSDSTINDEGSIQSRTWDFGDGTTSTSPNPSHNYLLPDTFNVTLIVINNFGCVSSLQKQAYIKVADSVIANFDYTYTNICQVPTTINFQDLSQSPPLNYMWDFGDGVTSKQSNPSHTYFAAGTYQVKLVASSPAGCADSTTQTITIGSQTADFIVAPGACVNEAVVMQDSSLPHPVSGTWNFGDGNTGTGLTVSHVYTSPGIYTITYTANFGSCNLTVKKTITIGTKPTASFNTADVAVSCKTPLTISFNNTSLNAVAYFWDFGDGSSSTNTSPTHTYTTSGLFNVTLIAINAGGCNDTIVLSEFVKIAPPVINGFASLPFTGCAPSTVAFRANISSPDSVVSYLWEFGDGTTSPLSETSHLYTLQGNYDVKLTVTTKGGCIDTFTMPSAVTLGKKPDAQFAATPLDACASTYIQFTDKSTGNPETWFWDFGDGGFSTDPNPLYKYGDTGFFSVKLTVTNSFCSDTLTKIFYVHINPPVAKFDNTPDCTDRFTKVFNDFSVAPETWHWDFGNGDTSVEQSPVYTYDTTGTYNVTLIVTNGNCADTAIRTLYVVDENPTFTATPLKTNFCKSDSMQFTAANYNPLYIGFFEWDFGDGTSLGASITNSNVFHIYQQAGTYSPSLFTTDINGCRDTVSNTVPVTIYGPTAAYLNPDGSCRDSAVVFIDSSYTDGVHPITQWVWNFGDGTTDTLTAPPFTHVYTVARNYGVKLIVFDSNGCTDTLLKPIALSVTSPIANFTPLDSVRCTSTSVTFINNSVGSALTYLWNFGDDSTSVLQSPTHVYAAEGLYNVTLIATDKNGCVDTIRKDSSVLISNPRASFAISDSASTCPPLPVQTTNNSTGYESAFWDFGDGNTSQLVSPFHYYTIPGKYTLTLIVQGYGACADTAKKIINLKGPNGSFSYKPLTACVPETIKFDAETENTTSYLWDFGDGATLATKADSVSYRYRIPGLFVPKLIIQDAAGCKVAIENTDTIKLSGVLPQFGFTNIPGCDSTPVSFSDSSLYTSYDPISTRKWNFGDGSFSNDINPLHYYTQPGTYNIILNMSTEAGCSARLETPVTVLINKAPKLDAQIPDSVCIFSSFNFSVNDTANIPEQLQWVWNFGNGDTAQNQNGNYTYLVAGTYFLSVQSIAAATGCADTLQKNITVLALPLVDAGADSFVCRNNTIALNATGANTYTWQSSPVLSCTNCQSPNASPDSTAVFYVTGQDAFGCASFDSVKVEVIQPTIIQLSVANDTICFGESAQLLASGAEVYNWQPSVGLSNNTIPNPVASPSSTTVYTVVGGDSKNCFSDTAQMTLMVAPIPVYNLKDSIVTIKAGSIYTVVADYSPGIISYTWSPAFGVSCPTCAEPVIQPRGDITYSIKASTAFECSTSDNITFKVFCDNTNFFIPNTFSPNGDGMNDLFYPRGTGLFTIKSMRIFNRWGQLIFQQTNFNANDPSKGWDGKFNGKLQNPDVYVYVIELLCDNNVVLNTKGNVTLLR